MPTGLALAALLNACAPRVGPRTLTAIIMVESGGNANAIHDNSSGLSYFPRTAARATDLAASLVAAGHSLDLGISQINSLNLPGMGLSVADMFDPCTNVHVSARILTQDYRRAVARFGPGQVALRHALGAYNTGSIYAGSSYISLVLAAAGAPARYRAAASSVADARILRHIVHPHPTVRYEAIRTIPARQPEIVTTVPSRSAAFTVEATADYGDAHQ